MNISPYYKTLYPSPQLTNYSLIEIEDVISPSHRVSPFPRFFQSFALWMDKLNPYLLQNIAKFLSLRDLFASFEPVCRSTKEVVNELCRQMKTLILVDYHNMSDAEFIYLVRRCCDITFLSLDYSKNMIACNQDLWEVNIYCPKLQIVVIHGSPIYANEFGDEIVARLAGIDGSIPSIFQDQPIINAYHIFCSARIIYLVSVFNLRGSVVATRTWSLMRYVLQLDKVQSILPQISLDQLVVCAFYVICRVHGINVSFHSILDVYTSYLQPYQSISNVVGWGDVNRLWFGIDLSFVDDVSMRGNKTMIELYNAFFVPLVYPVIQHFQVAMQIKKD